MRLRNEIGRKGCGKKTNWKCWELWLCSVRSSEREDEIYRCKRDAGVGISPSPYGVELSM